MKELLQAKVLATAVKISKNEINKRVSSIQEQLDSIRIIQGPAGPVGPKGDSGEDAIPIIVEAVGPQGEKGDKGDKGEKGNALHEAGIYDDRLVLNFTDGEKIDVGKVIGPRGGQGKQGIIGEQGPIGVTGLQGEKGPIGPQGEKGDKGDKGDIGNSGPRGLVGIQGDDGVKGDKGDRGDQGREGEKGQTGQTGLTGSRGDTGEKGDTGQKGPQGKDGRSVDLKPLQSELEEGLKTFKDSISSSQFCDIAKNVLTKINPNIIVHTIPIGDGGEGSLNSFRIMKDYTFKTLTVKDPLNKNIKAKYCINKLEKIGIIELAQASGIQLVPENLRNPLNTTSYGVGQLIDKAISEGMKKIIMFIGGSATNDAGIGMFDALGYTFKDKNYNKLIANVKNLKIDKKLPPNYF